MASKPGPASFRSFSASSMAGRCVSPPNMTCDIVVACFFAAATSFGCECPWQAAHQLLMPSMRVRPSARWRLTPSADSTSLGATGDGMGPYGCQMWSASKAARSAADACVGCGVGDFADAGAGDGTSGWVVSEAVMILKHNTCTTPDLNTVRGWW